MPRIRRWQIIQLSENKSELRINKIKQNTDLADDRLVIKGLDWPYRFLGQIARRTEELEHELNNNPHVRLCS